MNPKIKNTTLRQLKPEKKEVSLGELYLRHQLRERAMELGRPLIIANYVTDRKDTIAIKGQGGAPAALKNPSDWYAFQQLQAQADLIITGAGYLKRFEKRGDDAQNVLSQFEKGGEFAELGDWRLRNGYKSRNPDIAVFSRSLDFSIPQAAASGDRRILVFTTDDMVRSDAAKKLIDQGAQVIGAGDEGVDGRVFYDYVSDWGYHVVKLTTGPRVLEILLEANILDWLYITRVDIELEASDKDRIRVLLNQGLIENSPHFQLIERHIQKGVTSEAGHIVDQEFLVYEYNKTQGNQ